MSVLDYAISVEELIKELEQLDPKKKVILQKDEEGNGYVVCRGAEEVIVPDVEDSWIDSVYSLSWTADDCCLEDDEWEDLKNDEDKRAIVIFP